MANKFQKSVLERLEQENKQQRKRPIKETPEASELPETEEPKQGLKTETQAAFPVQDIGLYLRKETQRSAKNKTFYLDADVVEAVKGTARQQGVTDSKLVNDILRRVLGL